MPYIPKERTATAVVTQKQLERIDRAATELEMSRSEFIRDTILKQLSEIERNQQFPSD